MRVIFRFKDCPSILEAYNCAHDIHNSGGVLEDDFETDYTNAIASIPFTPDHQVTFLSRFRKTPSYLKLLKD